VRRDRARRQLRPPGHDTTLTTCEFAIGVQAHIVSWLHPFKEQKLAIFGTKKMAVFDDVQRGNKPRVVLAQNRLVRPHSGRAQGGGRKR